MIYLRFMIQSAIGPKPDTYRDRWYAKKLRGCNYGYTIYYFDMHLDW